MRQHLLVLLAFLAAVANVQALTRVQHNTILQAASSNPTLLFREWATNHSRDYLSDAEQFAHRQKIWLENLEYILDYNAKHTTHWLGLNKFADLSQEEYGQKYVGYDYNARKALKAAKNKADPFKYADVDPDTLPASIDWRTKKAVSEVKNQQQCGSCWAFSTTGSVEGINAIVTGSLISLSEQELVDCDTDQDKGCRGGLMDYAFDFIVKNKGLDTEDDYPYTATDGECNEKKKKRHVVTIDGYEDVPENDEVSLKKAVAHQPVSVAIEADQKAFQLYMGGVFSDETCGTSLDHGVLVVGYGHDSQGGNYWIVKNSWGAEWGEKGYIRLKQGVSAREGMCGIAMAASYPTKKGPNPSPTPEPSPAPGPKPKPSPSPSPKPVKCDDSAECPAGTTCCCLTEFLNLCLQWGCCPMVDATCCDDHEHCCPSDVPVCDTAAGRCLPKTGDIFGSRPWAQKMPATYKPTIFNKLFRRGKGQAS